jgi:hypothetical protein
MDIDFLLRAVRSAAEVKYINEMWGNFRFIEGTKTFEDMKSGETKIRFENLLLQHIRLLPSWQKGQMILKRVYLQGRDRIFQSKIMTAIKKISSSALFSV